VGGSTRNPAIWWGGIELSPNAARGCPSPTAGGRAATVCASTVGVRTHPTKSSISRGPRGRGRPASPCYAVVSLAASFTSTGTEGPIVVVRYSVFRYWPLAVDGLLRTRASTSAARLCPRAGGAGA